MLFGAFIERALTDRNVNPEPFYSMKRFIFCLPLSCQPSARTTPISPRTGQIRRLPFAS